MLAAPDAWCGMGAEESSGCTAARPVQQCLLHACVSRAPRHALFDDPFHTNLRSVTVRPSAPGQPLAYE